MERNNKHTEYEERELDLDKMVLKEKMRQKPFMRTPKDGKYIELFIYNPLKIIGFAKSHGTTYYLFKAKILDVDDDKVEIYPGKHYIQMPKMCMYAFSEWLEKEKLRKKKQIKLRIIKVNNYKYVFMEMK